MTLAQWSTTPGSNATASDNVNWAEGQAPSTVNNSARQEMTDVADWYRNSAEWIDRNDTVAFSSGTIVSFTSQDVTGTYNVGRRIKTVSATPGTMYGRITASSTSGANTLVTIAWDSTAVLVNEAISDVSIGIIGNSTGSQSLDAGNIARVAEFGVPTGMLMPYGSTASEPTGYLFCNGQTVSRTTYSDLFAVVSTTYGSTDASTFLVPDLRGRGVFGLDNMGGTSANRISSTAADTLGGASGLETTTATGSVSGSITMDSFTIAEANLPSSLTMTFPMTNSDDSEGTPKFAKGDASVGLVNQSVTVTSVGSGTGITPTGSLSGATLSGDAVNSMNPYMALPWIIKT